jgi:DNA polymerase-3 subunit gamma/tau
MAHKVLARKYRPATFSDLYGQDVLVTTVTNAIIHNKLHHAYLLHGIRGVGKTTSARIIANILNCSAIVISNKKVSACMECANCQHFASGSHPDIIEFDAASKTGVDDIRDILHDCEYRPILGKYKIFIIDEVHMLSKNAFNALLKMLEEPPAHVVFILATTELNKVPITVISRCQKFDLPRISVAVLAELIQKICDEESIKIEHNALQLLAAKADGSARDALSILYHLSTLIAEDAEAAITVNLINQTLATIDLASIVELFDAILHDNADEALKVISHAYKLNSNFFSIIEELLELAAYLQKKLMITNYSDIKYSMHNQKIDALLKKINTCQLGILWQIFKNGLEDLKRGYVNILLTTEMIILRAIAVKSITKPYEAIEQILVQEEDTILSAETIYGFIDHLYQTRNFDLYHYLLNEVTIIKYASPALEISVKGNKPLLNKKISEILFSWTGQHWDVITTDIGDDSASLKQTLLKQIEKSDDWKLLKSHFSNVKIVDLIHNKTCE